MTTVSRVESIKAAFKLLFDSGLSLPKIKDAALSGRLLGPSDDALGVTGRSLAWKLFLIPNEPLRASSDLPPTPPLDILRSMRQNYILLLLEKMRAPDGSYADGIVIPGSSTSPSRQQWTAENLETNNPLSLHNENPWTDWFASLELRKTIQQDVERTFPDIDYFREPEVQSQLTNILFLYSLSHPNIGYRQGMHELLAPLFYAVNWDTIPDDMSVEPAMQEMCSRKWVAADSWVLFEAVMRGVGQWYEWRDTPSVAATTTSPLAGHVQLNVPDGPIDTTPYLTPIVHACNRIQHTLLKSVDPILWKSMHNAGIEPQIYGIRWLRLVFTRELPLHHAMALWDGLFACDPTFELALWVCVAMLLRIRNKLIPSDYSSQLIFLLRYPTPTQQKDIGTDPSSLYATALMQQALMLQSSPTPSTGFAIVHQNKILFDIPVEASEPPPSPARRRSSQRKKDKSASESRASRQTGSHSEHSRSSPPNGPLGLSDMFAKGLLDRGESLGINKTLMSAVTEIKKNLPDLTASLVRNTPAQSVSSSSYPLKEERPPWEPRTRLEMEKEISDLHSTRKRLGESVTWIVDTLLQDEEGVSDPDRLGAIRRRKREALECLAYVRDVLNGAVGELEEERLVSEEEFRKKRANDRQAKHQDAERPAKPKTVMRIEVPLPAAAPHSLGSAGLRTAHLRTNSSPNPFTQNEGSTRSPSQTSATSRSNLTSPLALPRSAAPWIHTRSNFAAPSPKVTTSLPRLPPPTSRVLQPPRTKSPETDPGIGVNSAQLSTSTIGSDPLGALP